MPPNGDREEEAGPLPAKVAAPDAECSGCSAWLPRIAALTLQAYCTAATTIFAFNEKHS